VVDGAHAVRTRRPSLSPPPVRAAFLETGCGHHLVINVILTLIGWVPGIIHGAGRTRGGCGGRRGALSSHPCVAITTPNSPVRAALYLTPPPPLPTPPSPVRAALYLTFVTGPSLLSAGSTVTTTRTVGVV
jgi:hypothetical protein